MFCKFSKQFFRISAQAVYLNNYMNFVIVFSSLFHYDIKILLSVTENLSFLFAPSCLYIRLHAPCNLLWNMYFEPSPSFINHS
jgi:hypothetical protein